MDSRSYGTLPGGKAHIARAESQSVGFALYRTGHNLNIKALDFYHAAYHRYLLEILLSEIGAVGLHHTEKTTHHLGHTVEMAGTHGALHHFSHRTKLKHPGVGLGINLLDRREKRYIDPGSLEFLVVGLLGTRICAQVVRIVKLGRVDKHAHHHYIIVGTGPLYQ